MICRYTLPRHISVSFGGAQKRGQPWTREPPVGRSSVPVAAVRDRFLCAAVVRATHFFTARAYRTRGPPVVQGLWVRITGRAGWLRRTCPTGTTRGARRVRRAVRATRRCSPVSGPCRDVESAKTVILYCIYNCAYINDTI